jgi:Putative MetA-pathway of phenol degradation
MPNTLCSSLRLLLCFVLLSSALAGGTLPARGADACPTAADDIATDRPDVTNSSLVVPLGSFQAENGVDWSVRHGANAIDGTSTRLRLGISHCTEFLIDVPSYFGSLNGAHSSGFSNTVISFKRQLPVPFGFDLSATAGLGFPSGSSKISGHGYQPYIQFPWSHSIAEGWGVEGMFTLIWFPSESVRNPTFEPTLSLEKEFGPSTDIFVEYVGDYDHQRPAQLLDGGGAWRFTKTQQLDFHVGFGLNSSTVDHYFGIGYSFRFDNLFGVLGNSP